MMYMDLSAQMHASLMAGGGGFNNLQHDISKPAGYYHEPKNVWDDHHDTRFLPQNYNVPSAPIEPLRLSDPILPAITTPVHEPVDLGNNFGLLKDDDDWDLQQRNDFVGYVPRPSFPDYEDY